MRIGVPRALIVTMAALFSGYHIVLGLYTIQIPANAIPVLVAMVLYAIATMTSLLPGQPERMPAWMAALNVAVCVSMTLLITPQLDPAREGGLGYATWYVAAIGTLMTITSTRKRHLFAWGGIALLIVQTVWWGGESAASLLLGTGVVGSAAWVAISHILSRALAKASLDAQRFALAEREATDWQAAQEARLSERQLRLGQTSTMAAPMLRAIQSSQGELTAEQRRECTYLEAAIRDEIRGRQLLNDSVRAEVREARRRGATVTLFDEGGLDGMEPLERERVLEQLAAAIRGTTALRIIARTGSADSNVAVTVVGLTPLGDDSARELGSAEEEDDDEDEVDLWMVIPRPSAVVPH